MSVEFASKHDFTLSTVLLGRFLCPWTWVSFFGGIQHSPVNGCSAASCNFGVLVEKMSGCPSTLPSYATTLERQVAAGQPLTGECWIPPKKMPHLQGQRRSPSKTVGGAKSNSESNPLPTRDAQRAQTNLVCNRTQRHPRDLSQKCA